MSGFDRRFLMSCGVASLAGGSVLGGYLRARGFDSGASGTSHPFRLNYAPHFGMFQKLGGDLIGQLQFAADQGFTAWEDNGMKERPIADQQRIAATMQQLGMQMGVISATRGLNNKVNFAGGDNGAREEVLAAMKKIVDIARRVNAKYLTVVLGVANPKLPEGYQTASCVQLLKRCADIIEPHGLTMVIEPLNRKTDHPGMFLYGSPQAYLICKAVARKSCKILFDIYHQQITEGNLIANINACWDEIAYFQTGDNPGRNEPGTGEINYVNVLRHIDERGYQGIIGLEHGNSRQGVDGEKAVIAAYHRVDPSATGNP